MYISLSIYCHIGNQHDNLVHVLPEFQRVVLLVNLPNVPHVDPTVIQLLILPNNLPNNQQVNPLGKNKPPFPCLQHTYKPLQ